MLVVDYSDGAPHIDLTVRDVSASLLRRLHLERLVDLVCNLSVVTRTERDYPGEFERRTTTAPRLKHRQRGDSGAPHAAGAASVPIRSNEQQPPTARAGSKQ